MYPKEAITAAVALYKSVTLIRDMFVHTHPVLCSTQAQCLMIKKCALLPMQTCC